jgi:hypothetical protein
MLDLGKLESTGFAPVDAREALEDYLRRVSAETAGRTSTR